MQRPEAARSEAEREGEFEVFLDYEDSDEIRKAILHYEIFGRPLSLREPAGDWV